MHQPHTYYGKVRLNSSRAHVQCPVLAFLILIIRFKRLEEISLKIREKRIEIETKKENRTKKQEKPSTNHSDKGHFYTYSRFRISLYYSFCPVSSR